MFWMINLFLYTIAITLLVPCLVLLIECLAALNLTPPIRKIETNPTLSISVLIPAHNEVTVIEQTLLSLIPQVKSPQDILVVADNCSDLTAEVARQKGVSVIERSNLSERGKGYALDYGLKYLAINNPRDVVVLIDADCQVSRGTIEYISQLSWSTGQPVQVTYLMEKPEQPSTKDTISALAFLLKNQVRMLGLSNLKLPCPLQGTGMAFPFSILQEVSLNSGNIVEDMQLGIDLALKGHFTLFWSEGKVISGLPKEKETAKIQRTRWEQGHLSTLVTQVPRLIEGAIKQKKFALLALALDFAIPPLSFLVILWGTGTILSILGVIFGLSWTPLVILILAGASIFVSVTLSWVKFARDDIPLYTLLTIPFYILWKVPIYVNFLLRRSEKEWIKTDRN